MGRGGSMRSLGIGIVVVLFVSAVFGFLIPALESSASVDGDENGSFTQAQESVKEGASDGLSLGLAWLSVEDIFTVLVIALVAIGVWGQRQ